MWQDPIVTEVRNVREAHARQYHYDLQTIYEALKMQEQQNETPKVSLQPKLLMPTSQQDSKVAT
jgi:hypothetical protein